MILNIWETIGNFFKKLYLELSWTSVFVLLTGIVIGFIIFASFYLVIILRGVKQAEKMQELLTSKEDIKKNHMAKKVINAAQDRFIEEVEEYSLKQKLECTKDISFKLINDIAKVYYPDSKYPLSEISIEEIIKLNQYIIERVEKIFQNKFLRLLKGIKISRLMWVIDTKKEMDSNKLLKAAKKMKLENAIPKVLNVLNIFNPAYWTNKITLSSIDYLVVNKVLLLLINIVGMETAKVYSKNLFEENDDVDEMIANIEKEISTGVGE